MGNLQNSRRTKATIAIGTGTSVAINKRGAEVVGVILPAEFDGTALTLMVGQSENGTFFPLHNTAGVISLTVAASRAYLLAPELRPFPWFKLVSGTNQATTETVCTVFLED